MQMRFKGSGTVQPYSNLIPVYPFNNLMLIYDVRVEKRPHEWLEGVLGVSGLALSARTS
jgi:hypothetical protein